MNQYELTFSVNTQNKITVSLKDPLTLVGWNYAEPVLFRHDNKIITLANGPTYFNIRSMRDYLKKALNSKLHLHDSITSDIGYMFNQYNKNECGFIIERFENGFEGWTGYNYYLWEAYKNNKKYVTWIYNDHNNNIIFKITPSYPYRYCERMKKDHYIPFKKWILNYKPYFSTQLSRETAQQWLEQAEHVVKTVDDNIIRWEAEYKKSKLVL